MRGKRFKKMAISPVVATVLLIALVVVIALILFLWFRGMVQESVTKFGKPINVVCDDVVFEASYDSPTLNILNTGNIPIYQIRLKTYHSDGSFETRELTTTDGWVKEGLKQGAAFSGTISISGTTKILVFPILIGTSTKGKKTFVCEGQYGKQISF